jgi:hypothetical protein
MPKAYSVHSTPPTSTSARHSRRSILGAIAGSAAVAGGIAAAEGINLSANKINVLASKTPSKEITPSQGIEGDPIFAVIERHGKACREHHEAVDIHMDFEELGMEGEKLERRDRCSLRRSRGRRPRPDQHPAGDGGRYFCALPVHQTTIRRGRRAGPAGIYFVRRRQNSVSGGSIRLCDRPRRLKT